MNKVGVLLVILIIIVIIIYLLSSNSNDIKNNIQKCNTNPDCAIGQECVIAPGTKEGYCVTPSCLPTNVTNTCPETGTPTGSQCPNSEIMTCVDQVCQPNTCTTYTNCQDSTGTQLGACINNTCIPINETCTTSCYGGSLKCISGKCVQCSTNSDCSTGTCTNGVCTTQNPPPPSGCTTNSDCSGSTPYCNTSNGTCVACLQNGNCPPNAPLCVNNTCTNQVPPPGTCNTNSDCSGATPYCVNHKCVECNVTTDCPFIPPSKFYACINNTCSACTNISQCYEAGNTGWVCTTQGICQIAQ